MLGQGEGKRAPLLIFFLFLSLYLSTASGRMDSYDAEMMFRVTESIVEEHDLTIRDEIFGVEPYPWYGLGQSLFALPLYFLAKLVHGDERFFISLFNSFVTALAVVLVYLFALRLRFPQRLALLIIVAYGLGSLAWPYAKTFFSEPLASLALLATLYFIYRYRELMESRWLYLAGASIGSGILTRIDLVMTLPILGFYLLWPIGSPGERMKRDSLGKRLLCFLLTLLPFLIVVACYNFVRSGTFLATGYEQANARLHPTLWSILTGLLGLTLSSGKGIFWYMPVAFLSLLAWPLFWRERRLECVVFLLLILERAFAFAILPYWHGDVSWGPRYLVPIVPFVVLSVGYLRGVGSGQAQWIPIIGIIGLSALVQIPGLAFHHARYTDKLVHGGEVSLEQKYFSPPHSPILVQAHWLLEGEPLDFFLPVSLARAVVIGPKDLPPNLQRVGITYGDKVRLLGYTAQGKINPGGTLVLTFYWEPLRQMEQSYSLFVHIRLPEGQQIGERDTVPAGELHPTTVWQVGTSIRWTLYVPIAPQAYWPSLVTLHAGLYSPSDLRRLPAFDERGQALPDDPTIGRIKINPPVIPSGTRASVHLDREIRLIAYDIGSTQEGIPPGSTIHLILYWEASRQPAKDYTVFIHLVDEKGEIWAQMDSQPGQGAYPTSVWEKGEIIQDEHPLALPLDIPPGEYRLLAGMYDLATMKRLTTMDTNGKALPEDAIPVATVRIVKP